MSRTDTKLTEMHFLVHLELLVRHGAGKKIGFKKSWGTFMKSKDPFLER